MAVISYREALPAAMREDLKRAREQHKPAVVEIDTYRYRGHSVADPDKTYRDRKEIEDYRNNKDPLMVFQHQLVHEKVLTDALIEEIDAAARAEAERAVEFAEASPFPTADDIQKDVYWETDQPKRTSEGRIFFNSVE